MSNVIALIVSRLTTSASCPSSSSSTCLAAQIPLRVQPDGARCFSLRGFCAIPTSSRSSCPATRLPAPFSTSSCCYDLSAPHRCRFQTSFQPTGLAARISCCFQRHSARRVSQSGSGVTSKAIAFIVSRRAASAPCSTSLRLLCLAARILSRFRRPRTLLRSHRGFCDR